MKHLFVVTAIFLTMPCMSQITVGPKVGMNLSSQTGSEFEVLKTGALYGGVVHFPFTHNLSVQGEFLVTKKGYHEEFNGRDVFDELTATYLEIPALLQYNLNLRPFNYYAGAGVYWSYWSAGKYKSSVDGQAITFEDYNFVTSPDADGFSDVRSDFGTLAEAGVTYDGLGSGIFMLSIRYSLGLVATNKITNNATATSRKNKVVSISLTYLLFL